MTKELTATQQVIFHSVMQVMIANKQVTLPKTPRDLELFRMSVTNTVKVVEAIYDQVAMDTHIDQEPFVPAKSDSAGTKTGTKLPRGSGKGK